jgi:glutaredoxin
LLSDFWPHGAVAELYGVLRSEGFSERAIFIIDKAGYIRYVDIHNIDDRPDNEELRKVLRQIEAEDELKHSLASALHSGSGTGAYFSEDEEDVIPHGEIVVYCTRWCKDCKKVKTWLEERGLSFMEVDIDQNMAARTQVRQWANGFLVTPVIDIYGTVVLDFDVAKLEEAVKRKKG